ncbi:hypothetical protein V499_05308 [Pseudogymnoascus sp. VKM F-103]|nr:hypothetical protein V499_05308 [Pseudogymnoascus sp. VKM F-103]
MLVHPLLNPPADCGAFAHAVTAFPPSTALRPVEEILGQPLAVVLRGVGGAEELAPIVAALVVLRSHEGLTLLIPRRALSTRAGQSVAASTAAGAFIRVCICWTRGCGAGTGFLGITVPSRGATYRAVGGELAGGETAVLVRGVADGVVLGLEFAGRGVAAGVIAAPCRAATIAVLAHLDDAVAALRTSNGRDIAVACQTVRLDGLSADGAADVSDAAGGEVGDAHASGGVHDVFPAGWAGVFGEGTALLRCDGFAVGAGGGVAVVDGAEGVADFVGDDEPFGVGLDDDVGAGHGVVGAALGGGLSGVDAGLAEPGEADGGAGAAGCEEG